MRTVEWREVPVGIAAQRWVTRRGCRTVLVVGHTVASCERLFEALELIETDPRVQIVFTQAPDVFGNGVEEFLRAGEGVVIPWEQAVHERFDLALAAAYGSIDRVHAPLVVMPHGAGYAKGHHTSAGRTSVYGLDGPRLLRDGKPIPRMIVLSHDNQLDVLRDHCPEALEVAEVVGDLSYDRLVASTSSRDEYRAALGVAPGQRLVVVTSTWGAESLFGLHLDLVVRLMNELPPSRYRVAALVHPAVWFGHGPRQVKAWLADCLDAGLLLFTPELDWRAALVAADQVVGDHGSTTAYAAAIGKPVLTVGRPAGLAVVPDAPQTRLGEAAPGLRSDLPLLDQLGRVEADTALVEEVRSALTSRPGLAAGTLRRSLYRLLGLSEPGVHRALSAAPTPRKWCRS